VIIIEKLSELIKFIQSLNKKEFQQYMLATLSAIALLSLGISYYTYNKSSTLAGEVKKLNRQANRVAGILSKNTMLQQEEGKIRSLLEKNPNFSMKAYFEKFYTKHGISPKPESRTSQGPEIEGSEKGIKYQETVMQATFKKQTMKKLVDMLTDLYRDPIVYLKGLEITAENKKINFEMTLATKQYKKEEEEE